MTRYILNQLLRNKILMVWPGVYLVAAVLLTIYASAGYMERGGYYFAFGEAIMPAEIILTVLNGLVVLVALIALPTHLITNIEPGRASLLFTKPVSRTDFLVSDISATGMVIFGYGILSALFMALFFLIKGGLFPGTIVLVLLMLPLTVVTYYLNILLLGLLFKNYLLTVFFCYILVTLSGFLFSANELIAGLGIEAGFWPALFNVTKYLIPGAGASSALSESFLRSADETVSFHLQHTKLLLQYLISLIPFTLWAYYVIRKREF